MATNCSGPNNGGAEVSSCNAECVCPCGASGTNTGCNVVMFNECVADDHSYRSEWAHVCVSHAIANTLLLNIKGSCDS